MKAQLKDLWAAVKAVLGWKFLASKEHIREEESSTSSNLCSHPRKLEREEKIKFRESARKEKRLTQKSVKLKAGNP